MIELCCGVFVAVGLCYDTAVLGQREGSPWMTAGTVMDATFEEAIVSLGTSATMQGFKHMSATVGTTAKAKLVFEQETRLHENGALTQALLGRRVFSILYSDIHRASVLYCGAPADLSQLRCASVKT